MNINVSLNEIGFPLHLTELLASKKITTVEELIRLSLNDLNKLLIGKDKSINYIIDTITKLGLEFNSIDTIIESFSLDSDIKNLYLSPRSYNALVFSGICTVGDLVNITLSDLSSIRNIGNSSVIEITNKLKKGSLCLRSDNSINNINLDSNIFALNIKFGYRIDLARHGFKTIRELIKLERYELKKYTYYYLDVIDEIHSLGFYFADEKNLINIEKDERSISEENINSLNGENIVIKSRISAKKQLLNTYEKLIIQKDELLNQEQELDKKIEQAINQLNNLCGDKYVKVKK